MPPCGRVVLHQVYLAGSTAAPSAHLSEHAERAGDTGIPQGPGPDGQHLQQRLQRQQQHPDPVWTTATASGPASGVAAPAHTDPVSSAAPAPDGSTAAASGTRAPGSSHGRDAVPALNTY